MLTETCEFHQAHLFVWVFFAYFYSPHFSYAFSVSRFLIDVSKCPQKGTNPGKLNTVQEETQETRGQLFKDPAMPHGKL